MFPSDIIPPYINALSPYEPGKRVEDVAKELGLSKVIKLASNENCLGPNPKVLEALKKALPGIHRYGDAASVELKARIASKLGVSEDSVVCANGSSEFILVLSHAVLGPGLSAVMSTPSFSLYHQNAAASGAEVREVKLRDYAHDPQALRAAVTDNTRLLFLDNPVNPTGAWLDAGKVCELAESLPERCLFLLDEAYVEYAREKAPDYIRLLATGKVVILRTFSKLYGMAGLRAGYALMDPQLALALNKIRQPFNISLLAQVGAMAALEDDDFAKRTKDATWEGLDFLLSELPKAGLATHPTQANFVMARTGDLPGSEFASKLFREGVIVRALGSYGLHDMVRITVGLRDENLSLLSAARKVLGKA
ncbi:MAG: histidinol-phosphate transaminase [Deltaproteobacteria bacterium]|jgi:histidinol-phosphate aminotransferase|nr:histidinol-phosphate transaminase [Deltaproteobacteria bacterium]